MGFWILNAFSKVPPKHNVSSSKSEFEELEPSLSVIEGPLEPSASAATVPDVPDDSFVNFFSAAMTVGNASNALTPGQSHHSSASVSLSSHAPTAITTSAPAVKPSLPSSSTPLASIFDTPEAGNSTAVSHTANLVKPSFFTPPSSSGLIMPPITSSMPASPPLHPPVTFQRPYGAPLLQPFPPPTPSPSLTPTTNYGPVITRDKVRDALLRLVQNSQFIDMVYREMLNSHMS